MKQNKSNSFISVLCVGILALGIVSTANAELQERLGGVYDTDLNITWLSDANAAAGSVFDNGFSPTDGRMTWSNAMTWAADLNVGGVIGWRLPTADFSCIGLNCTNSEMGHLFYSELSGTATQPIANTTNPNLTLFSNIESLYWTSTKVLLPTDDTVRDFSFNALSNSGRADTSGIFNNAFAWAVHDGDVLSPVPEPHQYAMLVMGLAGMLGYVRLRRRI